VRSRETNRFEDLLTETPFSADEYHAETAEHSADAAEWYAVPDVLIEVRRVYIATCAGAG